MSTAWHGFSDQTHEGRWQWANPAGECKKYTRWYRGEPNGKRSENCGMMYKDYDGNWNDAPCDIEMGSICEFGATADKLCQSQKTEGMYVMKI